MIGDRAESGLTHNCRDPGFLHILLRLHSLSMGMYTSVEAHDRSGQECAGIEIGGLTAGGPSSAGW